MIITLCGSNRFENHFVLWNKVLSLAGHSVFTTSVYPMFEGGVKEWYEPEDKTTLDLVHLKKIQHSDAVLILNVHAYVGDSTMRDLEFAKMSDKKILALESWGKGNGPPSTSLDVFGKSKEDYGIDQWYASPIWANNIETARASDVLGPGSPKRNRLICMLNRIDK